MITRKFYADILVYSADNRLQLIIEIKTKRNVSAVWGAQFRQNLLESRAIPSDVFFMFVFVDQVFVWKPTAPSDQRPDYIFSTALMGIVQEDNPAFQFEKLGLESLEWLIRTWLYSVMDADVSQQGWLVDSGLYEAIKNGQIRYEALP